MSDDVKFDVVNKAAHYNSHPSGVECKHIVRHLGFDLGNTFKYVYRREGKETVRSLKSAIFYLKDWWDNFGIVGNLGFTWNPILVDLIVKVINAEKDTYAIRFYSCFLNLISQQKSLGVTDTDAAAARAAYTKVRDALEIMVYNYEL